MFRLIFMICSLAINVATMRPAIAEDGRIAACYAPNSEQRLAQEPALSLSEADAPVGIGWG